MAIDLKAIDKKKVILVGIAIVMGIVSLVLANSYMEAEKEKDRAALVASAGTAKKDIDALAKKIEELSQQNRMLAAKQQESFAKAQQAAAAAATKTQTPLSLKTPPGKRAVTVNIDKLSAVGGLVSPGDYVDIIAHLSTPNPKESEKSKETEKISVTLFQNVLVLAIADNTQAGQGMDAQQKASILPITFALNPDEANLLAFAEQHGKLQLVLRQPGESESYQLPTASWDSLSNYLKTTQGLDLKIGKDADQDKPVKEESKPVEIFRGGQ
ncbi:MAG: Flp pilus assembly protein CpaB [Candidatus Omnitrophota bacterium]